MRLATLAILVLTATLAAAEPGTPAPAFSLPNASGATVNLADFSGKIVVLEWVNFGCPFVKKHYGSGNLPALQATYTAKDVVWLSICSSAPGKQGHFTGANLTEAIASNGAKPSHYLLDESGTVGKAYGARTTPELVVIGKDGTLLYQGAIDSIASADAADIPKSESHLINAVEAVLKGEAVKTASTKPYGCSVKY